MGDDDHRLDCCRFTNNQDPFTHPVVVRPSIPANALLESRMLDMWSTTLHSITSCSTAFAGTTGALYISRATCSGHCSFESTDRLDVRLQIVRSKP